MHNRQAPWDPAAVPTFWVNHASRLLMRRFDERLRPLGFSMAYLHVAFTLKEHGPLQQKDLLGFIHVEQPTMAALLKRMEAARLISRKRDPKDARAQLVTLTSRAMSVLVDARDAMTQVVEQALLGIAEHDRANLVRVLQVVVENLSDDAAELTDRTLTE